MSAACVIRSYMSFGNCGVTCIVWPILLIGLSLHVHGVTCLSIAYTDSSLCLNINSAGFRHFVNSPFIPQHVICGCARADSQAGRCMGPSAPPDGAMI